MKFSVLMSIYSKGDAEQLDDAIKSIVRQTLQPDEIVIVKDGPLTDELDAVIEKYDRKYDIFKIVKLAKNAGLGIALNLGIEQCSHELIARMDADDIATPDRFEKQIRYIAQFPEAVMVGANVTEYDENMVKKLSIRKVPESYVSIKRYAKTRNPFNHMTVIFRKTVVKQAGGYQDCPYFEDYYLWLRMLAIGGIMHNIQDSLVHVRGGSTMIARRGGFRYAMHSFKFLIKAYRLGSIGTFDLIKNMCVRIPMSIAPSSFRGVIYSKSLRKKNG